MPKIFFIMGKSSSGKDTVFRELLADKKLNLRNIVGYTTRPIREGETEGREYHFVDVPRMNQLEAEGKIIEKRTYHTIHGDWHYFMADDGQIKDGQEDYIIIGTLESYAKMREYFGLSNVFPIYIEIEDGLRLERALKREKMQPDPRYSEMCRRFLADEEDFSVKNIQEQGIGKKYLNNKLSECLKQITEDILLYKQI